MSERTYENPGNCIKCGYPYAEISWDTLGRHPGPEPGVMIATCMHCGYYWKVLAKDEIG